MASLLDLLSAGGTVATRAKTATLQGQRAGREDARADLLARIKMDREAEAFASAQATQGVQRRNLLDQIRERNETPTPDPETFGTPFDAQGPEGPGLYARGNRGTVQRLPGLSPIPKTTQAEGQYEERPEGGGVAIYEGGRFAKWKIPPPQTAPTRAQLPTEGERKAAAFYASGKQGYEVLEKLLSGDDPATPEVERGKPKPVPGWAAQQMQKVGFGAGNVMTNADVRQMRQAALMLSDAWLRYTSGAAVPEQEVERFAESFIPRAGDDPATLAQKREARTVIIEALRKGAGRALNPATVGQQPGTGDDLDAQIDAVLSGRQP